MANVAFTLISSQHFKSFPKHFRLCTTATSLGLPESLFLQKLCFFETIKAAYTGIRQLNIINMRKYTYRHIHSCFPGIWQHIKALTLHKITVTPAGCWSHLGGPTTQKNLAFKQPMNHREFGFSFQDLMLLKLSLGQGSKNTFWFEPKDHSEFSWPKYFLSI